jgi:L-amino acid N-acyltransferase YncA
MTAQIRLAVETDGAAVADIYAPFCESSAVSFETEAPTAAEMASRIRAITSRFPWLVLEDDGAVAGYAYASQHRDRAAYGWSADVSVYVHPAHCRRGVGRALYSTLFEALRRQGYFKAYAGITQPNPPSVALHQAVGFVLVGTYRGVGYKQSAWHDVAWYQKSLQPERANPGPPLPVSAFLDTPRWIEILGAGLKYYNPKNGHSTGARGIS